MNPRHLRLLTLLILSCTSTPYVGHIYPRCGSIAGETLIEITGDGFSDEAFTLNIGGQNTRGNVVYLYSSTQSYKCDIRTDLTHSKAIFCFTEPMPYGNYNISVHVDGVIIQSDQICRDKPVSKCMFFTRPYCTPRITRIDPQTGPPDQLITVSGIFYSTIYLNNKVGVSDERKPKFTRIYFGGQTCEVLNQTTNEPYDFNLTSRISGKFKCKLSNVRIGGINGSVIIDMNYGRSISASVMLFNNLKYGQYEAYAEITSITPHVGSQLGGTILTIFGRNFYNDSTVVLVGGRGCKIRSISEHKIVCQADKDFNGTFYSGSRGFLLEYWNSSSNFSSLREIENYTSVDAGRIRGVSGNIKLPTGDMSIRLSGIFRPPKSGRYQFDINDKSSTLFCFKLNNSATICEQYRFTTFYLLKGRGYYINILKKYNGESTCHVVFKLFESPYSLMDLSLVVPERQSIILNYNYITEKHRCFFPNQSMSPRGDLFGVQIYKNKSNAEYRISFNNVETEILKSSDSARGLEAKVNQHPILGDYLIKIENYTNTENATNFVLNFTIHPGDSRSLSILSVNESVSYYSITKIANGTSGSYYLLLKSENYNLPPIALNFTASEIEDKLMKAYEIRCPKDFNKSSDSVFFVEDFETSGNYFGNSFCGGHSKINLIEILNFTALRNKPNIVTYKMLCFAYNGYPPNALYIVYSTNGKTYSSTTYNVTLPDSILEWNYECVDLAQLMNDVQSSIVLVKMVQVVNTGLVYYDLVSLSTTRRNKDKTSILTNQRVLPPSKYSVRRISVSKVGDHIDVTYLNYCFGNIPPAVSSSNQNFPYCQKISNMSSPSEGDLEFTFNGRTIKASEVVDCKVTVTGTNYTGTTSVTKNGFKCQKWNSSEYNFCRNPNGKPSGPWCYIDLNHTTWEYCNVPLCTQLNATHVKSALEYFSEIGKLYVSGYSNCENSRYHILFLSYKGDAESIRVTSSNHRIRVSHYSLVDGHLRTYIPQSMVRQKFSEPQVEVIINESPSLCSGNCSFSQAHVSTPTVTSIEPLLVQNSETNVTLRGTLLSANSSSNIILLGGNDCVPFESSPSEINCSLRIQNDINPLCNVSVLVEPFGYARLAQEFCLDLQISVHSVSDNAAPVDGGKYITIDGFGFVAGMSIMVESMTAVIVRRSIYRVTFVTPKQSSGIYRILLITSSGLHTAGLIVYTDSTTPVVSEVHPTRLSVAGGQTLTLNISNLQCGSETVSMKINNVEINQSSCSNYSYNFMTPSLPPGNYSFEAKIQSGVINKLIQYNLTYVFKVTSMFPAGGSIFGGTELRIGGEGFGNSSDMAVSLGNHRCEVNFVNSTFLSCETSGSANIHKVTNLGVHSQYGKGYRWLPDEMTIRVGDYVLWEWSSPPAITSINYKIHQIQSLTNTESFTGGFDSGNASNSGTYKHQFLKPGKYFYWSLPVIADRGLSLKGIVNVVNNTDESFPLNVTMVGIRPDYAFNTSSTQPQPPNCPNILDNCTLSSDFNFTYSSCGSPKILSVSKRNRGFFGSIVITGTNFGGRTCQNSVSIDGHQCVVIATNTTQIDCKMDEQHNSSFGYKKLLRVWTKNVGYGLFQLSRESSNSVYLMPEISTVVPNRGSTKGDTLIAIIGWGFDVNSTQVRIGPNSCFIESLNGTQILCRTPNHSVDAIVNISVKVTGDRTYYATNLNNIGFHYSQNYTPAVLLIEPTNITGPNTTIKLWGINVTSVNGGSILKIQSRMYYSLNNSQSGAYFLIPYLDVGEHQLSLDVEGYGKAEFRVNNTINSYGYISTVEPASGSIYGGTTVKITGFGFNCNNITANVENEICGITHCQENELFCRTPPALTPGSKNLTVLSASFLFNRLTFSYETLKSPTISSVIPMSGSANTIISIIGRGFGGNSSECIVLVGNEVCNITSFFPFLLNCAAPDQAYGNYSVKIKHLVYGDSNVVENYTNVLSMSSIYPPGGGYGGGQVVQLYGNGFTRNVSISICGTYSRILSLLNHSQLVVETPTMTYSRNDTNCTVTINTSTAIISYANQFTYSSNDTSFLYYVTPKRGGTGGGTNLSIYGHGFGNDPNVTNVSIDGSVCVIRFINDSLIQCESGLHHGNTKSPIRLYSSRSGLAVARNISDVVFEYVNVWSSRFTWGGYDIPRAGEIVVIPRGLNILLDVNTPVLKILLINGGSLTFDEKDVELHAENIFITNNGSLRIGSEGRPFQHQALVELHSKFLSKTFPIFGSNVVGVRSGVVDLHGRYRNVTWTRLVVSANVGDNVLELQDPVDWDVNETIVIASTGDMNSARENEVHKIANISPSRTTITLYEPIKYHKLAYTYNYARGKTVHLRAEVGLLTRNVKIRGTRNLNYSFKIERCPDEFQLGQFAVQTCFQGREGDEIGNNQFGGTVMIAPRHPSMDEAIGRISHVEFNYVGQAFRLGRYPIHFHLTGWNRNSYVNGCAIHESFNRAVNIHGSHGITVRRNVNYNIMGGAFFLEDGIETHNVFEYNLHVYVKRSSSLLNDDVTPAGYWITNPNNIVRYNTVAGGTHFGFWYRLHKTVDGPSYDSRIAPNKGEMGIFEGNEVHSQGWYGIWIFEGYYPRVEGGKNGNPTVARFTNFTSWNNQKGAEWANGGALQFDNFVTIANKFANIEMMRNTESLEYSSRGPFLNNSDIIAYIPGVTPVSSGYGVVLPLSNGLTLNNIRFYNYNESGYSCFYQAKISGTSSTFSGGFLYLMRNIHFINSNNRYKWNWIHEGVIADSDGSQTGSITNIVPYSNLVPPDCVINTQNTQGIRSSFCPPRYSFARLSFNEILPSLYLARNAKIIVQYGEETSYFAEKRVTSPLGWVVVFPANGNIFLQFPVESSSINISYTAAFDHLMNGGYVIVSQSMREKPDRVFTTTTVNRSMSLLPLNVETNVNGEWYYDSTKNVLSYIVMSPKTSSVGKYSSIRRIWVRFSAYRCFYPKCEPPPDASKLPPRRSRPNNFVRWSNRNIWSYTNNRWNASLNSGVGGMPSNGSVVVIPADTWVLADVTLPTLKELHLYGVVEFDEIDNSTRSGYRNFVLSVEVIFIRGGRIIAGTEDNAFKGKLSIVLRGNINSQTFPRIVGPVVGTKVIASFGGIDLHGVDHNVYSTTVNRTAFPGERTIYLEDAVDWSIGEEIVISTSSYNVIESEKAVIRNVTQNGLVLHLMEPLRFNHVGETYTIGTKRFKLAASVGLLTRNIRIIGSSSTTPFGGRILVGSTMHDGVLFKGFARLENVEFIKTGQLDFDSDTDARYSVTFMDIGDINNIRPSYVRKSSFRDCFSPTIGVFRTNNLEISNNVIYRPVGPGIISTSSNTMIENNLMVSHLYEGTYNGRNFDNIFWRGAITVNRAQNTRLVANVVAGSESLAYRIRGTTCDEANPQVFGNVAKSGLNGVAIFHLQGDPVEPNCLSLNDFLIWKFYNYGLYVHSGGNLIIQNVHLIENNVGFYSFIFGPSSLSHQIADKYVRLQNSTVTMTTPFFDCRNDVLGGISSTLAPSSVSSITRNVRVGLFFPNFISESLTGAFKDWNNPMTYPSLGGLLTLSDLDVSSNEVLSCSTGDVLIMSSRLSYDFQHPIRTSNIRLYNISTDKYLFMTLPPLGKVNPSDCVDMDCDGNKKTLINDLDGSLLGSRDCAAFPKSEFAWNGDRRRGTGDYRLPTNMKIFPNGSQIPINQVRQHVGIIRNSNCTYNPAWKAYKCCGGKYRILVIESMDNDTEKRRLSPIAIRSEGYVDLLNGPADHGWCDGYTCQRRISTFYSIVSTGKVYQLFMSSTVPRHLRLRLLNAGPEDRIVVEYFFDRVQGTNISTNGVPIFPSDYMITPGTTISGGNYRNRSTKYLQVGLKGSQAVDVEFTESVIIGISSVVSEIDFFGSNVLENLISFLGISRSKVRVVNIVRETSSNRAKRSTASTFFLIEISNLVNETANSTDFLTDQQIQNISSLVLNTVQSTGISSILNISISTISIVEPIPPTSMSGQYHTSLQVILIPDRLLIISRPSVIYEESVSSTWFSLVMLDPNNATLGVLGSIYDPWQIQLEISTNGQVISGGQFLGQFILGTVNFSSLRIPFYGNNLNFTFRSLNRSFIASIGPLNILKRQLSVDLVLNQTTIFINQPISGFMKVIDIIENATVGNLSWRISNWTYHIDVADTRVFQYTRQGPIQQQIANGSLNISYYPLSQIGFYILNVQVSSHPNDYNIATQSRIIRVHNSNFDWTLSAGKPIVMVFDRNISDLHVNPLQIEATLFNYISLDFSDVNFANFQLSPGTFRVMVTIEGNTTEMDTAVALFASFLKQNNILHFADQSAALTSLIYGDKVVYGGPGESSKLPLILGLSLGSVAVVGVASAIIWKFYFTRVSSNIFKF